MFDEYLRRWNLTPDGAPIITPSSRLLPVRQGGLPAMLKIAVESEEKFGNTVMVWWNGNGAARVFAHDSDALLIERTTGTRSLIEMAQGGGDDTASRIICQAVARLHTPHSHPMPALVPLPLWFRDLEPEAAKRGGILAQSAAAARALLADPQGEVALHGDIHHANILDFGERGWLAIDPKGLRGERGFDYANLFCNPDHPVATAPGRLARQATVVAEAAGLDRRRLLQWILAWAGLSATWSMESDSAAETALTVAEMAHAELARS